MTFQQTLARGKAGESRIAMWLRGKGFTILPTYEIIMDSGKGPQLYCPEKSLICPDLFVFKGDKALWIEAKHKTAFTWHRNTGEWVTGIDKRHYADYCTVDDETPWPVWLLFLHDGGQAKDSPPESPAGLFGNKLSYLRLHEHHTSDKWGNSGMVYWGLDALKELGTITEI